MRLKGNSQGRFQVKENKDKVKQEVDEAYRPNFEIQTWLKLHSSSGKIKQGKQQESKQKYYPSPNLQLNPQRPNHIVFHNYQKFDTYDFKFDQIFKESVYNTIVSSKINLYEDIVEVNRDVAVLVIGGVKSGLAEFCEGKNGKEGVFYSAISQLWDRITAAKKQNGQSKKGFKEAKLLLRFIVISNDKITDLINPKNQVSLKQNKGKVKIIGCSHYQVNSIYDFFIKMKQICDQKTSIYPQSIMVVEGELMLKEYQHDEQCKRRFFTLIEWQKSLTNKTGANNNQSLLALNMCIFELYKFSCRQNDKITTEMVNKLWSIFRNCSITKILKHFMTKKNKMLVIGCISTGEFEDKQTYQTLMLCKNMAKIHFKEQHMEDRQDDFTTSLEVDSQKVNTQSVQSVIQSRVIERTHDFIDLSKVKLQLKKILKEKEQVDDTKKKQSQLQLLRKSNLMKKELQRIKFKKQEINIFSKCNQISQNCSNSKGIKQQYIDDKSVLLPNINNSKQQQQQMSRLAIQEAARSKELEDIQHQIIQTTKAHPESAYCKSILQMEIKMQEKEIINFIDHKNRVIGLLKRQVREFKHEENMSEHKILSPNFKMRALRSNNEPKRVRHIKTQQSRPIEDPIYIDENPEQKHRHHTIQNDSSNNSESANLMRLKSLNKGNYLFQKRRMTLKIKMEKGRESVNKFYDEAAQKFQEYKRSK